MTKEEIESLGFTYYTTVKGSINNKDKESDLYVALMKKYDAPIVLRYYPNDDLLMIKSYSGPTNISREYKLYYDVTTVEALKQVLDKLNYDIVKPTTVKYNPGY